MSADSPPDHAVNLQTVVGAGQPTSATRAAGADFDAFYRDFFPQLVAGLIYQGAPAVEALDLAQETMIDAYRSWSAIQHPKAWTLRVASRKLIRSVATIREHPVATMPDTPGLLRGGINLATWPPAHEILDAIRRLPPRQRQIMAWTLLLEYTPSEIAAELNISAEAVRSSLRKARKAIATYKDTIGEEK